MLSLLEYFKKSRYDVPNFASKFNRHISCICHILVFVDILLSTQNINDENMGKFFSRVKKLNMTDKSNQHRPLGVKSSLASVAVFL